MKILHIITGLKTGGAERSLYNLLKGGLAKKFENHVISLMDVGILGPQIQELGIKVDTLMMSRGVPSVSSIIHLKKLINKYQPDLIQGWMYHGNIAAAISRKISVIEPVMIWNIRHSLYGLSHEKFIMRQVIRAGRLLSNTPDTIIYNSQKSREQHEDFGYSSKNGKVIPNGIDINEFCFSIDNRRKIRSELHLPDNDLVIGHIARYHPMKGHKLYLQASVEIAKRHPDIQFVLVGKDVASGNTMLEKIIPNYFRNRFHLLGERRDIPDLMSAMDIFCTSSEWGEGFPNVIGEAMATNLTCLVTDVGDSSIIIGDTGMVVLPGDVEAFVNKLELLLSKSKEERRLLGENARKRIETKYALESIVDQYTELYEYALNKKRVPKKCVE